MDEDEKSRRRDEAFQLEQAIKQDLVDAHQAWWKLAQTFWVFRQGRYWLDLKYNTIDEFLAQPDVGVTRSTFFRFVQAWDEFHVRREIEPEVLQEIEPSKALVILPAVRDGKVEPEQAVADATAMGYRDLRQHYKPQPNGGKSEAEDDSTSLDASAEPVRVQCELCGSWYTPQEDDE